MVSSIPARFMMRLVKRKPREDSSVTSVVNSPEEHQQQRLHHVNLTWPSRSSTPNTVSNRDNNSSGSFELTAGLSPVFSANHSKESNSSTGSKQSIPTLKEVVGDGAIVFHYKELSRATKNFSSGNKIGNSVYRGTIGDGTDLAITIHKKGDAYSDLVPKLKSLCSVHHSNVVSMLGAYADDPGDYVYVVYPFIDGAKLRDCIRNAHSPGFCVLNTWTRRIQVAVDVAKGLEYLHEGTNAPLVHKYIKSNNILVDSKTLRAKIAQFGVADLAGEVPPPVQQYLLSRTSSTCPWSRDRTPETNAVEVKDQALSPVAHRPRLSRCRSKKLTGTRGYMAPEYMKTGAMTEKLDVFAFGLVLLELLSGKEAIDYRPDMTGRSNTLKRFTLSEAIRAIMEDQDPKARLRQWIDPLLKDSYPVTLALRIAKLAKSCVDTDPSLRPEMRSVAFDLSRLLIASERWEANMMASKDLMSRSLQAR